MELLIQNIENFFHESWQAVLDKGIALLLSPLAIIEIIYYYNIYTKTPLSRDAVIFRFADMKIQEISAALARIKNDISEFVLSKT